MSKTKLFDLLELIPSGQISTYKILGEKLNLNPRVIGKILHANPNPTRYPCHRIVKSDATLASGFAFGGKTAQKKLLENEGVVFEPNGKIKNFPSICFAYDNL